MSILRLIWRDAWSLHVVFGAHGGILRLLKAKLLLIQWDVTRLLRRFKFTEYLFCRLIDGLAAVVKFLFVRWAFLSENLESKDKWLVGEWTVLWIEIRIRLEENVSEAYSKVRSINVQVLLARYVHFLATWAIDLDTRSWQLFWKTNRQYNLPITEDALACAEDTK